MTDPVIKSDTSKDVYEVLNDVHHHQEYFIQKILSSKSDLLKVQSSEIESDSDCIHSDKNISELIIPNSKSQQENTDIVCYTTGSQTDDTILYPTNHLNTFLFEAEDYINKEDYELCQAELELERREHQKTKAKLKDMANQLELFQTKMQQCQTREAKHISKFEEKMQCLNSQLNSDNSEIKRLKLVIKDLELDRDRIKTELEQRILDIDQLIKERSKTLCDHSRAIEDLQLEIAQERYLTRVLGDDSPSMLSSASNYIVTNNFKCAKLS